MKKHKPKKKKSLRNPPLSFLDKIIYGIMQVVLMVMMFSAIKIAPSIQKFLVFLKDASVVACYSRATVAWGIIFLMFLVGTPLVYISALFVDKKPIFGNKKISYGVYPWTSDCYPRFGKQGRKPVLTEKKKKYRRIKIIAWLVGFIILLSIAPFGMNGRKCLYEDNSITYYNMANKSYAEYDEEDFSHLNINAGWNSGPATHPYLSAYWYYAIEIEMKDGESVCLEHADFRNNYDHEETLNKMLEIKKLFKSDEITIDREDVEVIIDEFNLNEKETTLINDLFDIK